MDFNLLILAVYFLPTVVSLQDDNNQRIIFKEASSQSPAFNEEFQQLQLQAIKAYKKKKTPKIWKCSYADHLLSQSYIPTITKSQGDFYSAEFFAALNGTGGTLLTGATSISDATELSLDVILVWKGVFVNSIEYKNVLYGGTKTYHVGLGTPVPQRFFSYENQRISYYDLISCLPFTEWIIRDYNHQVRDILMVPTHMYTELRNKVLGIGAVVKDVNATKLASLSLPFSSE